MLPSSMIPLGRYEFIEKDIARPIIIPETSESSGSSGSSDESGGFRDSWSTEDSGSSKNETTDEVETKNSNHQKIH